MRTVSYRLVDLQKATINIGKVGENDYTRVQFDCKRVFDEYPSAVPALSVINPAGTAYPAVITHDGDYVIWDVQDSDLTVQGVGEFQLSFSDNGTIVKSCIGRTLIDRSIVADGEAPDPVQSWLEDAEEALADIPSTINTALAQAKASGEFDGPPGQDGQDGAPGQDGQDGVSPTVAVASITGGHRVTITDAQGDHPFDVMDGEGGGAQIDDTAGSGDTDRVWSADKSAGEVSTLSSAIVPVEGFMDANNLDGNVGKRNLLLTPYALSDMVDNAMIASDGSLLTGNSYKSYMVSPLIAVSGAGLYGLKVVREQYLGGIITGTSGFAFYKADGTTSISRQASDMTSLGNELYTIQVPEETNYVRFTIYKNSESYQARTLACFNQWVFLPNATADIDASFFVVATPKTNGAINKLYRSDNSYLRLIPGDIIGKNILVFGDSIWGNDRTDGVSDFLAEYSGANIYNCALGGTWIYGNRSTYSGAPAWKAFDGVNLIHAKITNTWTDQDTYVGDVTSYASTVLTLLKSVDMSKMDIVILSYGTNDFNNNISASDIAAAYASAITEILTNYPKIRILICSPAWRMFNTTDGDEYENTNDETLRDVVDAILTMAKSNHVEALDMLAHLPWRALTKGYYLDNDEVHPNTEGNKVYAHVVNGKLLTMY